jgi:broad specificity phosphatase PhoE
VPPDTPDRLVDLKWPRTLWLVRHGQSAGNVARDAAEAARASDDRHRAPRHGRAALDAGRAAGRSLGLWFGELPPDEQPTVLLCSPYLRAIETARLLLEAAALGETAAAGERRAAAREGVRGA